MKYRVAVELIAQSGASYSPVQRRKIGPPSAVLFIDMDSMSWEAVKSKVDFHRMFSWSAGTVKRDLPRPFTSGIVLLANGAPVLNFDYFFTNIRAQVYGKAFWNLRGNQYQNFAFFKRILNPRDMSREERVAEMLDIAAQEMFWDKVGQEAADLVNPRNLAVMAGILALCASNPIGWLAAALGILLGAAGAVCDYVVLEPHWQNFQNRAANSATEDDLRDGAESIAIVMAKIFANIVAGIVLDRAGKRIPTQKIKEAFLKKSKEEWKTAAQEAKTSGASETPPAAPGAAKPFAGFKGFPDFRYRSVDNLLGYLRSKTSGFERRQVVRKPGELRPDGTPYTDFQSEIWVRIQPGSKYAECIRIDPHGHVPPKFRDGRIRLVKDPKTGKVVDSEWIAHGEVPHYHKEVIPAELVDTYLKEYVPTAESYTNWNQSVPVMQQEAQLAQQWYTSVMKRQGAGKGWPNKFELQHIPLSSK